MMQNVTVNTIAEGQKHVTSSNELCDDQRYIIWGPIWASKQTTLYTQMNLVISCNSKKYWELSIGQ